MKISATVDVPYAESPARIRVWDLPTRLFHWLLVVAIVGALVTQYIGGAAMLWHFRFGYAALTLVLFRILWGIVGTRHARFANFVRGPSTVIAYMTGRQTPMAPIPGHNPLGALSVLAMLGAILLQTCTGLFANDDIAEQGPLAKFIDKALSDQISTLHSEISIKLIYALFAVHIAAIAYHLARKRVNLVQPMLTGDKLGIDASESIADSWFERAKALACLCVSAAGVWFLSTL